MNKALFPDFLLIPRQLLHDKDLQPLDGQVYGVIYWYTHLRLQTCIATNEQIADVLGVSKSGVNKAIIRLVKKGYVQSIYDRNHHTRTLLPLISFRQTSTIPDGTVARSQRIPPEQAVSQTGQGNIPNGKTNQPQLASPKKKSEKENKEQRYNLSSGTVVPKDTTNEKQYEYGNEEVNSILQAFTIHIGHLPSDKKPRQVAHNIRQITHSFIRHQSELFEHLRGRALTFAYVQKQCWQWYLQKDYALSTENLETVKRKMRVYLADVSKHLHKEAATKNTTQDSESVNQLREEGKHNAV